MAFGGDWVPQTASGRRGLFTLNEAIAHGMTPGQVRHRRRSGAWIRVAGRASTTAERATPDFRSDPWILAHAAALTWPDAVTAFGTAARLHRLPVEDDGAVHVILPVRRAAWQRLVPHTVALDPDETVRIGSAVVTNRRRTIIDCLGRLRSDERDGLLAWVVSRRSLEAEVVEAWRAAHRGSWGNRGRADAAVALRTGAASPAEVLLHRLLRRAGITGWAANARVSGAHGVAASADVWFADVRLVLEVDGRRWHGGESFQEDRTRQNALVAAGCTVLRFTWDDLSARGDEVVGLVASTLRRLRAV